MPGPISAGFICKKKKKRKLVNSSVHSVDASIAAVLPELNNIPSSEVEKEWHESLFSTPNMAGSPSVTFRTNRKPCAVNNASNWEDRNLIGPLWME